MEQDQNIEQQIETADAEQTVADTDAEAGVVVNPSKGMTVVEVSAIAYAALGHSRGDGDWNSLEESERRSIANLAIEYLNNGAAARNSDESLLQAMVNALRPYLAVPVEDPVAQVWNGGVNVSDSSTWIDLPFSALKQGMIFKIELHPGKFWASATPASVRYDLTNCVFAISSVEAVVAGPKAIDEADLTKGFTLSWKTVDEAKAPAEDTAAVETAAPVEAPAAVEEQVESVSAQVDAPAEVQATNEVQDVTYTEVTDPVEAQAVREAAAYAVQQGELQAQGQTDVAAQPNEAE